MTNTDFTIPETGEYPDFFSGYISKVSGGPVFDVMQEQIKETLGTLSQISEEKSGFRYAEGKWSIKEVVGHLIDTERVMAYRALAFARGGTDELPGMDQDEYVQNADYSGCGFSGLVDEFAALRSANVNFFRNLKESAWSKSGIASGHTISVRALASIIAGHETHHMNIIRERYLG